MNDIAHQLMVQEALSKRFGRRQQLICRYEPKYPSQAEREFQRVTSGYMRNLNTVLKEHLPEIRDAARSERESSRRQDDTFDLLAKVTKVFDKMAQELTEMMNDFGLYNKITAMAALTRKLTIKEWKRAVKSTLGIELEDDYYTGELFRDLMEQWINDNVSLIRTIPQDNLDKMREIVLTGYRNGETTTSIVKKIQKVYSMGRRHARLIARDQIAKLNSNIAQRQQRDAGVEEYIWSDSRDSRVRDSHRALNGKKFRWDDPPIVDHRTGRRCHPGEDYQCRCTAMPVFSKETVDLPLKKEVKDQ